MKILIIGSKGQLARELQHVLALDHDPGHQVIALGHTELDLTNPEQTRQQVRNVQPELIVNAGAYTAVDQAESHREEAFAVNAVAPGVLAEEAARLAIPLIHYSTDYVFDGWKVGAYTEEDEPNPLSVYGASKLAGERAIQAVGGQHLILRTSWVYSLHGRNFLLTMQRLLQERDHLTVVSDEIGAPTWAGTIAETTARLIQTWRDERREMNGLYHLTASGETSWHGFASTIGAHLAQQGRLRARIDPIASKHYPKAAARPLNSRLDCQRLQRDWGVQLPHWETALQRCLSTPREPLVSAPSSLSCSA